MWKLVSRQEKAYYERQAEAIKRKNPPIVGKQSSSNAGTISSIRGT